MMTRQEETNLLKFAASLREEHPDSEEFQRLAGALERAAQSGDPVLAAETASAIIMHTLDVPVQRRRRFISG